MSRDQLPKYVRLADHVRGMVRRRRLQPGDAIPTEPELEADFGCGRGTVRRALDVLVSEGLIRRKQGAGHFVARQTESNRQTLIGLIVPNLLNAEILRVSQLTTIESARRGYQTLLCVGERHPSIERDFVRQLDRLRAAGVLKFPTITEDSVEHDIRTCIRSANIPYVLLNDFWYEPGQDHRVGFDESTAISQAVDHLLALGHREIGWIDGSDGPRFRTLTTLRTVLRAHGLDLPDSRVYRYLPYDIPVIEKLFPDRDSMPTAIITPYDGMAVRLIEALSHHGIRVPEDVSVVNLNGHPLYSTAGMDITTAVPPDREIVNKALDIVTNPEDGKAIAEYRFKTTFSHGRSSAPRTLADRHT